MRSCVLLLTILASVSLSYGASQVGNVEPAGYCFKATNLTSISQEQYCGDWVVLYSTDIRTRKGASYWGGIFPYDLCDPMNLGSGCMGVGISLLPVNQTKQVGYIYGFNAFTDTWTIEQVTNYIYTIPNTNLVGYRLSYNHYIQVKNEDIFVNGQPVACGSKIVRSGPIYRSSSYVFLGAASDFSWVVIMYCDSFYGYVDKSAPVVQVIIKRDILDKCSYPFNTLYFYKELREILVRQNINVYAADFKLVYHDVGGMYPSQVSWSSIQWEADCVCTDSYLE